MREITTKVYTFDELSDKAKERAHDDWIGTGDWYDEFSFQVDLDEKLSDLLEENGIKVNGGFAKILYSLGHCQGDGVMFHGDKYISFEWKGLTINIAHNDAHYYHMYTAGIDIPDASEEEATEFLELYRSICKKLEEYGYARMEEMKSKEYFEDLADTNEWEFAEDGKII